MRAAPGGVRLAWLALAAACAAPPALPAPEGTWAFTGPWDARSAASLAAAEGSLDAVVTGWIALDSLSGAPRALYADGTRDRRGFAPRRLTLVTTWLGDRFHPAVATRLAADPALLERVARAVARLAADGRYRGLVLDLEGAAAADSLAVASVVGALAREARARGTGPVVVAVPATDTLAYRPRLLLAAADLLLVMLYDQHWAGSRPGPVASPEWAARWLDAWLAHAGPDRLVAGFPTYGYAWRAGTPGEVIGLPDLHDLAAKYGEVPQRDARSGSLVVRADSAVEAWAVDEAALRGLRAVARDRGVTRIALWRLGLEDPALWHTHAGADEDRP